jgi:hypothetical protein
MFSEFEAHTHALLAKLIELGTLQAHHLNALNTVVREKKKFSVSFLQYNNQGGQIPTTDLAEIAFINTGTCPVVINSSLSIPAGGYYTVGGNEQEVDKTNYSIMFNNPGGALVAQCNVIKREYV